MARSSSSLSRMRRALGRELPPLVRLAGPVVASEVGWMAMWLADTIIVGRLGAEAIGAVSIGGSIFFAVAIFGLGMMLGLDFVVASAFGAGRIRDAHAALVDGLWLAAALAVALTALLRAIVPLLPATGIQPAVLVDGIPYLHASSWSLLPLLLFTALRRYLQALGLVRPILVTILTANVVNVAACWVLVFGNLGAPALGASGSGWATTASRVYMFACLALFVVVRERAEPTGLWETRIAPAWGRLRELVRLGFPAAMQITAEVGVFSVVTALAARFEPAVLAAHQIALNSAAFTFMVPAGLASAAAVRVGQAVGRCDPDAVRRAGWTALALGLSFMAAAALSFVTVPGAILGLYTSDTTVLATGVVLLLVAGAFQLFDGMQVVLTGALRGLGDTRTPMLVNLVGYWLLGLPFGCVLCFGYGVGVPGLWIGLCAGLMVVAPTLLVVWARRSRGPDAIRDAAGAIAASG
jgi:MATE family multidrug resistance protein